MVPTPPRAPGLPAGGATDAAPRIDEIDVLRGFALFGITLANTIDITGMPTGGSGAAYWAHETLLNQRFFPIFAFLFGLSFGLFLDAAARTARDPRTIMAARLGFLILFGAAHRLLQPREILLTYAVIGIIVLLPASYLPRRWLLALGGVATAAALALSGSIAFIPGLFLLGYAVQRYGPGRLLGLPTSRLAVAFTVGAALALVLNALQITTDAGAWLGALAGLVTATAYLAGLLLLLRTPAERALRRLAPVGRMALTCYIGATVLIVAADQVLHLGRAPDYPAAMALGLCVFAVELAFCALWLRHARYGPLEWVWRCLTWWRLVPIRRDRPGADGRESS
ncbi:DUF418 domain-containing protein [Actinomadura sp. 7K534]|uniref:DUF418 domain-containing protein n=1 Tax=Actinomadura sp. 7K534 TaxID=2530366 RepID=UPI001043E1C2|nr:DUF418 domain-containing protein [Actinomadura sp. 7K534]TDB91152.1 DUF418 domain-containing protein [Actinomadura sp. 7K534]